MLASSFAKQRRSLLVVFCLCLVWHLSLADLEEFYFSSPDEIEELWQLNYRETIKQAKENGDEMALSGKCDNGGFHCLRVESPITELTNSEKKKRNVKSNKQLKNVVASVAEVTRMIEAEQLLMLPGVEGNGIEGAELKADGSSQLQTVESDTKSSALVDRYAAGLVVKEEIALGAVVDTGALPKEVDAWKDMAERHRTVNIDPKVRYFPDKGEDVEWFLAANAMEKNSTLTERPYNMTLELELLQWFEEAGGELNYVDFERLSKSETEEPVSLVATESLEDEDIVMEIPLKVTLSQLTHRRAKNHDQLRKIFEHNQEWGLACFLLTEYHKKEESKYWPFIRTLRMPVMGKRVSKELEGSYTAELTREFEKELNQFWWYLDSQCQHDFEGRCLGFWARNTRRIRWALSIVRRYSVTVYKRTTGRPFPALVPFAHLLQHAPGAGGNATLEFNGYVKVAVSNHRAGSAVTYERGRFTDAEAMLRYHRVGRSPSPYNHVHLSLPGSTGGKNELVIHDWRRQMKLPGPMESLWVATHWLEMYGDEWDTEEQTLVGSRNAVLAGQPLAANSQEQALMMLGGAASKEEAALILAGKPEEAEAVARKPQLYAVRESEAAGSREEQATDRLAFAMDELEDSMVMGWQDPSILKVINRTRDFFVHGVKPAPGPDEIDKLLKRTRMLINECGSSPSHVITASNLSEPLLCAMRLHFANESEIDLLCPTGDSVWRSHECRCLKYEDPSERKCVEHDIRLNISLPLSRRNEQEALGVLRSSVQDILQGYTSSVEDDEVMLSFSSTADTPIVQAAVRVRLWEKQMLLRALGDIETRLSDEELDKGEYQIEEMVHVREAQRIAEEERKEWVRMLREEGMKPKELVVVPIDLGGPEQVNVTIYEGDELEAKLLEFAINNSMTHDGLAMLTEAVKARIPQVPPPQLLLPVILPAGVRSVFLLKHGDNMTEAVREFCVKHHITDYGVEDGTAAWGEMLLDRVNTSLASRSNRRLLLTVPVSLPDGRNLLLEVRQGQQHDLVTHVTNYAMAYRFPDGIVWNLANAVNDRLPGVQVQMPVSVPGVRGLQIRYTAGENVTEVVEAFVDENNLSPGALPQLRQALMASLNPDAVIMPARADD